MKEKVETVCKLTVSGCLGLFFGIIVFGVTLAVFYAYTSSQQKESVDIEKVSKKEKQFASDLADEKYVEMRVEMYQLAVDKRIQEFKDITDAYGDLEVGEKFVGRVITSKDDAYTNILSLKTEVASFTDTDEKKKFTSNLKAALRDDKITNHEYGVITQDYAIAKSAHSKHLLINQ